MWVSVGIALLAVGCGRLAFEPGDGGLTDGPRDTSATVDAPASCAAWGPWGAPAPVAELNTPSHEYSGTITADGKLFCFSRLEMAALDLMCATRPDPTAAFDAPQPVAAVNTPDEEADPALSADGLELYFAANRAGSLGEKDVYVARRTSRDDAFVTVTHLPAVSSALDDEPNAVSADGLALYINAVSGGSTNLVVARRAKLDDPFGAPVPLMTLNTVALEEGVALSADGLEIVFGSSRAGGAGGLDVYTAGRAKAQDDFGALTRVPALSSADDDLPGSMSADGSTLYLNFNMSLSGAVQSDVWRATRSCLD